MKTSRILPLVLLLAGLTSATWWTGEAMLAMGRPQDWGGQGGTSLIWVLGDAIASLTLLGSFLLLWWNRLQSGAPGEGAQKAALKGMVLPVVYVLAVILTYGMLPLLDPEMQQALNPVVRPMVVLLGLCCLRVLWRAPSGKEAQPVMASELQKARQDVEQLQMQLRKQQLELHHTREWSRFHASLGDLLQQLKDPDVLAQQALDRLGPALQVEQITLIRIQNQRARLWHAWGDFLPARLAFLMGEGTLLQELQLLGRVVEQARPQYFDHYNQETGARTVAEHHIAAGFQPILSPSGQVVAVLAFSRPEREPWTERERQLAAHAAITLALALELAGRTAQEGAGEAEGQ